MNVLKIQSAIGLTKNISVRNLWGWLNIVFNSIDEDRRKLLGPDRTCAEWLLRNGASVKWTSASEFLKDYNELPSEDSKLKLYIKEVDASDSSISHYGFGHFVGCKRIETIVLHKCCYIEDKALLMLEPLKETLKYLRISNCDNVTDTGLNAICILNNLEKLIIGDLPYLKSRDSLISNLNTHLPKCHITVL